MTKKATRVLLFDKTPKEIHLPMKEEINRRIKLQMETLNTNETPNYC